MLQFLVQFDIGRRLLSSPDWEREWNCNKTGAVFIAWTFAHTRQIPVENKRSILSVASLMQIQTLLGGQKQTKQVWRVHMAWSKLIVVRLVKSEYVAKDCRDLINFKLCCFLGFSLAQGVFLKRTNEIEVVRQVEIAWSWARLTLLGGNNIKFQILLQRVGSHRTSENAKRLFLPK